MTAMNLTNRKAFLLVFGTASAIVLLTTTQRSLAAYLSQNSWPPTRFGTLAADAALWYVCALAVFPIHRIALRFPLERTNRALLAGLHFVSGLVFALFNITVQSLFLAFLSGDHFLALFQTAFLPKLYMRTSFYFMIAIACYAYISYQRHRNEELTAYRLESRLTFAQFQMLKSKLSPEFLFETLRAIGRWIRKDIETADLLTARLGDFLRLSLESSYAHRVTLQQEVQLVRSYLDIQRVDAPDVNVSIAVDSDAIDVLVPNGVLLRIAEAIPPGEPVEIRTKLSANQLQVFLSGWSRIPANFSEWTDQLEWKIDGQTLVLQFPLTPGDPDSAPFEESSIAYESLDELQRSVALQEKRIRLSKTTIGRSFWRIFGLWTFVVVYFLTRELLMRKLAGEPLNLVENIKDYIAWYWWAVFTPIIFWLARKFPIRKYAVRHLIFSAITSAVMVVLYYLQRWALDLGSGLAALKEIIISYPYPLDMLTYMAILGVYEGLGYHRKYLQEELRTAKLRGNLMEAQLQALKMQLHPHFLFNTLNSISELIHEDAEAAKMMLKRLEEFLRITFQNSDLQEISLEQELVFLRNYLEIQQVRFQNRLRIDLKIDPQTMKDSVPNLILQPIVENAIRHGIASRSAAGKIEIRASHTNGLLQLQVEDDGPGLSTGEYREGLGIANTRMRLEQLYGKECGIEMSNNPYGGLLVSLQIPVRSQLRNL